MPKHPTTAKQHDRQAKRNKRAMHFWGGDGTKAAKVRSGGKGNVTRGARRIALEQSAKVVKHRFAAARIRGLKKITTTGGGGGF